MEKLLEKPPMVAKENYKNFLRSLSLFADFPDDALSKVLKNALVKQYKKDKVLFITGDKADFFYIIIDGWIKLFRETKDGHEAIISILTHGDMFGRNAILKSGSIPYSGQVVTNATLLMIPANFMLYMAENHEYFDDFLNHFLEGELNEFNQKGLEAEHLSLMNSAERVGCFLLRLCGNKKEDSTTFQLPYEKSMAAGRLGMTPETFSRSLNQLSAIGVETNNSLITINNIAQLQARICEHCSAIKTECPFAENND